jgi:hypothetical protein
MKAMLKSFIITSLFTFSSLFVFAQDAEKNIMITASGRGKSKEDAKRAALRSTIDQVIDVFFPSKSELLKDQFIKDQIIAAGNGNIKSYTLLKESQLPDNSWSLTLKAEVSVTKLASFIEAKGISTEFNGGIFAMNIKQQLLNEQSEIKAINEMIDLVQKQMESSFDFTINSGEPKSADEESKNWIIPITVTAITNKNMDFCASHCIKTLQSLSLSDEEVSNYKNLNKAIFNVVVKYNDTIYSFYLRKNTSFSALDKLFEKWEYYTRLFKVESGIDELNSDDFKNLSRGSFIDNNENSSNSENVQYYISIGTNQSNHNSKVLNFLSAGKRVAVFSIEDTKSLSQIEKITGYKVKPIDIATKESYDKNGIFTVVQIPAEFPGGVTGWANYLQRNLKRDVAEDNGAPSGKYTVIVSFVVDKNGGISEVQAENDPGYGTAEEAVRVIKTGPSWIPAFQRGKSVTYRVRQSITFLVSEE